MVFCNSALFCWKFWFALLLDLICEWDLILWSKIICFESRSWLLPSIVLFSCYSLVQINYRKALIASSIWLPYFLIGRFAAVSTSLPCISSFGLWNTVQVSYCASELHNIMFMWTGWFSLACENLESSWCPNNIEKAESCGLLTYYFHYGLILFTFNKFLLIISCHQVDCSIHVE